MGSWTARCALTGVSIQYGDEMYVQVIRLHTLADHKQWERDWWHRTDASGVCAAHEGQYNEVLPIFKSTYDSYGGCNPPDLDKNPALRDAIEAIWGNLNDFVLEGKRDDDGAKKAYDYEGEGGFWRAMERGALKDNEGYLVTMCLIHPHIMESIFERYVPTVSKWVDECTERQQKYKEITGDFVPDPFIMGVSCNKSLREVLCKPEHVDDLKKILAVREHIICTSGNFMPASNRGSQRVSNEDSVWWAEKIIETARLSNRNMAERRHDSSYWCFSCRDHSKIALPHKDGRVAYIDYKNIDEILEPESMLWEHATCSKCGSGFMSDW